MGELKPTDMEDLIERVENRVGMGHGAWDTVNPADLVRAVLTETGDSAASSDSRSCTCHPDDSPPKPCPRKFALSECRAASSAMGDDGITLTMEQAKCVFEALDIGLGAATQEAAAYHEAMKGYRPHRHKALDDDAAKVSAALTVIGQLLEDAASPSPSNEREDKHG